MNFQLNCTETPTPALCTKIEAVWMANADADEAAAQAGGRFVTLTAMQDLANALQTTVGGVAPNANGYMGSNGAMASGVTYTRSVRFTDSAYGLGAWNRGAAFTPNTSTTTTSSTSTSAPTYPIQFANGDLRTVSGVTVVAMYGSTTNGLPYAFQEDSAGLYEMSTMDGTTHKGIAAFKTQAAQPSTYTVKTEFNAQAAYPTMWGSVNILDSEPVTGSTGPAYKISIMSRFDGTNTVALVSYRDSAGTLQYWDGSAWGTTVTMPTINVSAFTAHRYIITKDATNYTITIKNAAETSTLLPTITIPIASVKSSAADWAVVGDWLDVDGTGRVSLSWKCKLIQMQ